MRKRVGVIGASGYTGFEIAKLLEKRDDVELLFCNSDSAAKCKASDIFPGYNGNIAFTNYSLDEINELQPELVFLAMRDGYATATVKTLTCKLIDLSRDLRFSEQAVYGLPEINRERIRNARLVANPGCYATGCILGALPLVGKGMAERIIFDCKSGYSGAGRTTSYLNDSRHYSDNVIAYKITSHPHRAEIQKYLNFDRISFTPHVVPLFRGIMCTIHILPSKAMKGEEVYTLYSEYYKEEPFVEIVNYLPELHDVQHTNMCC
ncbi:MAG: hypothetical protein A2Y62_19230, partial [Candidatus Fischerbacteria bacterium RBG_13_37_8]